jgi:hypothetical protein
MSISSASHKSVAQTRSSHSSIFIRYVLWLFLPGLVIGSGRLSIQSAKRKVYRLGSITVLVFVTLLLLSCGGVSTGGGSTSGSGNSPVTYTITVTGTSPGVTPDAGQSAQVILVVD